MIRTIAAKLFGPRRHAVQPVPATRTSAGFPQDPYEAQQQLLHAMGETAPVVFDIGAHRGLAAKEYRALFPGAAIYCFEPFPESVAALKANLAGDPAIEVIPKAVSDKSGRRTFFVNGFDATNSLLPRPTTTRRYYPQHAGPKSTIEVETISLDDFVARAAIPEVTVLKFDIQGGELMALKGAAQLLKRGTVMMIYTEIQYIHLYEKCPLFNEIWTFLSPFGYQLFDIYNLHRAANGQLRYGDALFVHDSIRKQCIDGGPEEP